MNRLVLFLLAVALLATIGLPLSSAARPTPPRARARATWRGFNGPPYLPAQLPRRPRQHVLDSLAGAARRRPSPTANPTR